jgi:hypothetical protein
LIWSEFSPMADSQSKGPTSIRLHNWMTQ